MAIRTSEATDELMGKLAAAQSKIGVAIKASVAKADKFEYTYADLAAIIDACMEHVNGVGIAVSQHPSLEYKTIADMSEAFVTVTTRLQYGNQWIESDISIPAMMRGRFDAQSVGSAITYGCRYALQSIFVVPREDDDAKAATGRGSHDEAQAVGQAKVAKLREKVAPAASNVVPSLFWVELPSGMYEINGDDVLKKLNKDILRHFWDSTAKAIVVTGEQLEDLKYSLEQRKTPFSALPKAQP